MFGGVPKLTEVEATNWGQPPVGGKVYETVYVPGVLEVKSSCPVDELIVNPAGALKVPPVDPVNVTLADVSPAQYGDPG